MLDRGIVSTVSQCVLMSLSHPAEALAGRSFVPPFRALCRPAPQCPSFAQEPPPRGHLRSHVIGIGYREVPPQFSPAKDSCQLVLKRDHGDITSCRKTKLSEDAKVRVIGRAPGAHRRHTRAKGTVHDVDENRSEIAFPSRPKQVIGQAHHRAFFVVDDPVDGISLYDSPERATKSLYLCGW